jgi:outer membrane lipoprotein-sorting protein
MKKLSIILFVAFLCSVSLTLGAQTVDEILQAHSKVMGYDKLEVVKTISIVGDNHFGERSMPFKTIIKLPSKYYNERDFMGRKMIQVVNGEIAWTLHPMRGLNEVKGSQLEMLKRNAIFGGMLYHWKEKGLKVSLIGAEDFEGTEVLKLLVEDEQANISEIYLDAESYISLKQVTVRVLEENEIRATKVFSNYKMIDGIAVAFNSVTTSDGQAEGRGGRRMGGGIMVIKSIEFNTEVDDSIFIKPESKKEYQ